MLTKSKIMTWRQCPKRAWLEEHEPQSAAAGNAARRSGHHVGAVARQVYQRNGPGVLVDRVRLDQDAAIARTTEAMQRGAPIFEGGFRASDVVVFADILEPGSTDAGWKMVEVKSSTSVKNHHRDDAAIQFVTAKGSGASVDTIVIAHIDSDWVYQGDGDYGGLFSEVDLTVDLGELESQVPMWIQGTLETLALPAAPVRETGKHCGDPWPCQFLEQCQAAEPQAKYPIAWLPGRLSKRATTAIAEGGLLEMAELADELLSETQQMVKAHTLAGTIFFDEAGAAADLAVCAAPFLFLDFETAQFEVPIWAGTRPYQQLTFQFSLHRLGPDDDLEHFEFLDLTGGDPSRAFAEALIRDCGTSGSIFVFNIAFERTRLRELADRYSDLAPALTALVDRLVDLMPIAKRRYYHPDQHGSWSIKKLLPCIAPSIRHADLEGVQDGSMAMDAYREAVEAGCPPERIAEIDDQLRRYCRLDTLAMVAVWARFAGEEDLLVRLSKA